MTDLGRLPGWREGPFGIPAINNHGQVMGTIFGASGGARAVLWTKHPRVLRITMPDTPTRWTVGTRQRLVWTYSGDAPQFLIEISRNGGATWDYITTLTNAPGDSQYFYWRVTGPPTAAARFRVTAIADGEPANVAQVTIRIANPTNR